jgi:hypothetical protein
MLNRPKIVNAVRTKVLVQFFSPVYPLPHSYFWKKIRWYSSTFFTHNLPLLWMFQRAHNMPRDMSHTHNTHIMFKAYITWTQNVFRYHKVKTNGTKGRLSKKIVEVIFVLYAFYNLRLIWHLLYITTCPPPNWSMWVSMWQFLNGFVTLCSSCSTWWAHTC